MAAAALFLCRGFGVEIDKYAVKLMRAALQHWEPVGAFLEQRPAPYRVAVVTSRFCDAPPAWLCFFTHGFSRLPLLPASVKDRVVLVEGDATQTDFSRATVIFCSMLPDGMEVLEGILTAALKRGSRVVCLHWPLKGIEPDETDAELRLYMYRGRKEKS